MFASMYLLTAIAPYKQDENKVSSNVVATVKQNNTEEDLVEDNILTESEDYLMAKNQLKISNISPEIWAVWG